MKNCAVLFLVLVFMGCASFSDIRKENPVKTLTVQNQSPETLANCSLYHLKSDNKKFNATLVKSNSSHFLLIQIGDALSYPYNLGEISFKPVENDTEISLKMNGAFIGYASTIWDSVIHCASPQNSPGK